MDVYPFCQNYSYKYIVYMSLLTKHAYYGILFTNAQNGHIYIMSRNKSIPEIVKLIQPDIHPDDTLYGLYRNLNCNCSAVARYITEKTGINVSISGVWRHIERIDKDRIINGMNGAHKS